VKNLSLGAVREVLRRPTIVFFVYSPLFSFFALFSANGRGLSLLCSPPFVNFSFNVFEAGGSVFYAPKGLFTSAFFF